MTTSEHSARRFRPTRVYIGTRKSVISKFIEHGCADFNIDLSGDWKGWLYLTDESESISFGFKTYEDVKSIAELLMEKYPGCKFYII